MLVETTSAGFGEGPSSAPRRDWVPSRLGANPPEALVAAKRASFEEMLAAAGTTMSLHLAADGTAQRESYRRYLFLTVMPLGRLLADELSRKLETPVKLDFSSMYAHDLVGRASAFKSLVGGGMAIEKALAISGLLSDDT